MSVMEPSIVERPCNKTFVEDRLDAKKRGKMQGKYEGAMSTPLLKALKKAPTDWVLPDKLPPN